MPDRVPDADLIRRLRVGDRDAAGTYYDRYFDAMFREARKAYGPDESACLDVVHDAMLKVIKSPPKADVAEYLEAWSRRVARSVAVDRARAESRRGRREQAAAAERASVEIPREANATKNRDVHGLLGRCEESVRTLL
ncbi:MAG: sigma factor, partial [Planctomycetota bacterium]